MQFFFLVLAGVVLYVFLLYLTANALAVTEFFFGFFLVILAISFFAFCFDRNFWLKMSFYRLSFGPFAAKYLRWKSTSWSKKHKGRVCCYADKHGLIEGIVLIGNKLVLQLKLLEANQYEVYFNSLLFPLCNLPQGEISFDAAVRKQFKSLGLELIDDISVEHRAIRSAEGWMNELQWSREALKTLSRMDTDLKTTLQMAPGNKLLERSMPAMEDARKRAQREYADVEEIMTEATDILRQLFEFLSVPSSVRRVLSFDKVYIYDSERHEALRQSFDDVVSLNDAYRDLCS